MKMISKLIKLLALLMSLSAQANADSRHLEICKSFAHSKSLEAFAIDLNSAQILSSAILAASAVVSNLSDYQTVIMTKKPGLVQITLYTESIQAVSNSGKLPDERAKVIILDAGATKVLSVRPLFEVQ